MSPGKIVDFGDSLLFGLENDNSNENDINNRNRNEHDNNNGNEHDNNNGNENDNNNGNENDESLTVCPPLILATRYRVPHCAMFAR